MTSHRSRAALVGLDFDGAGPEEIVLSKGPQPSWTRCSQAGFAGFVDARPGNSPLTVSTYLYLVAPCPGEESGASEVRDALGFLRLLSGFVLQWLPLRC
jgi:hypothetical protein